MSSTIEKELFKRIQHLNPDCVDDCGKYIVVRVSNKAMTFRREECNDLDKVVRDVEDMVSREGPSEYLGMYTVVLNAWEKVARVSKNRWVECMKVSNWVRGTGVTSQRPKQDGTPRVLSNLGWEFENRENCFHFRSREELLRAYPDDATVIFFLSHVSE